MTTRSYFTLCIRDDSGEFHDEFGSHCLKEIKSEIDFAFYDVKSKNRRIVKTDGSRAALIAAIAELNGVA